MDAELRPNLNHEGILCQNSQGVWSVRCVNRLEIRKNAELAGQTCTLLGFSGYQSHNVVMVNENGAVKEKRPPNHGRNADFTAFGKHSWDRMGKDRYLFKRSINLDNNLHATQDDDHLMEIVGTPQQCFALSIVCVPHMSLPFENTNFDDISSNEKTTLSPHPLKITTENIIETTTRKIETHKNHAKPIGSEIIIDNFAAPWVGSIFVDGDLTCIGVLLDRFWVLVQKDCIDSVRLD